MNNDCILNVRNLSKSFFLHEQNKTIPSSQAINFTAYQGELTALVGPTGAGKSSVLKSIYRSYLPSSGEILYTKHNGDTVDLARLDEHDILSLRKNEIGFVTQFLTSLPRQTTEDVVAMPLCHRGVDINDAREQARGILASLNLPEKLWTVSPTTFSGGEKQRVNLARGLLSKPRLLLLDEPTASLDPATAELVIDAIASLKQQGVCILAIFHHPELVDRLAEHVVTLEPPLPVSHPIEENII